MGAELEIAIFGEPPSVAEIAACRQSVNSGMSIGMQVFWYTPIPGIDVLAGLATHAIDYAINGDRQEPLQDDVRATERDWSAAETTQIYVQKVRSQGRPLIKAEAEALSRHLDWVLRAKAIVTDTGKIAADVVRSFWS